MCGIVWILFLIQMALGQEIINQKTADLLEIYKKQLERKYPFLSDQTKISEETKMELAVKEGTEVSQNFRVMDQLLEGDIVPTEDILRDLIAAQTTKRRRRRKVTSRKDYYWDTKYIPYTFDVPRNWERNYISDYETKDSIRLALKTIEQETCIRFYEQSYYSETQDGLHFFRGDGCYSNVGWRKGSMQGVSIGNGCENIGIVMHEVGHSLGFWHEQSRPDRGNYVQINLEYIQAGMVGNFEKRSWAEIETFDTPYDLGSVMHYGPKGFSFSTNFDSMESLDPKYQRTFGQRAGYSFIDAKQINMAYCKDQCSYPLPCQHGGYPDPNYCSKCRCPTGLGGTLCDRAQISESDCGGDLKAGDEWDEIKFGPISPDQQCFWHIKADSNQRIMFEILELDYPKTWTCQSFLEIKFNSDFQQTGPRICDLKTLNGGRLVSETSEMLLIHYTDPKSTGFQGFKARYKLEYGSGGVGPKKSLEIGWGGWSQWSSCNAYPSNCGSRSRSRTCYGGSYYCPGRSDEKGECGDCKIVQEYGSWGGWGEWSVCWPFTGCGTEERIRVCFSAYCTGGRKDSRECGSCHSPDSKPTVVVAKPDKSTQRPDIENIASWTEWSSWSMCYVVNDKICGYRERVRACIGSRSCDGPEEGKEVCGEDIQCQLSNKATTIINVASTTEETSTVKEERMEATEKATTSSHEDAFTTDWGQVTVTEGNSELSETTRGASEESATAPRKDLLGDIERWFECLSNVATEILDKIRD